MPCGIVQTRLFERTSESMNKQQPRRLDLKFFKKIAETVTDIVEEVKRVKSSEEFGQLISEGEETYTTVKDAVEDASGNVKEMIALALELYETSKLRSRSLAQVMPLEQIATREDFIQQAVIRLRSLEQSAPDAA